MGRPPTRRVSVEALVSSAYRGRPNSAMIEIADRCNETCVHCYQVQGQKGEMPTAQVEEILRDLAASGILFLTISGGEATLRSDLLDIIRTARDLGFVVNLFTNGLRVTPELAGELAALEVRQVEISLYADQAEKHDWITQVPGSFDKTVSAIRSLVAAGLSVMVKTPLMVTNMHRQDQFEQWVTGLGAVPSISPDLKPREGGDRSPEALRADRESSLRAYERMGLLPEPGKPLAPPEPTRGLCGACRHVHIEADGQLRPCSMLEVPIGDAKKGKIVDQVEHSPAAEFMREATWNDLPGCHECAIASLCQRCHAHALAQVGDALRPYPSACSFALARWEHQMGVKSGFDWAAHQTVGPFRAGADGGLERFDAVATPEQEQLYREHPWLKGVGQPPVPAARPGELVQLRRPGRRDRAEKVPE
ncbi:MAG: radical SAM protein [Deltaproteobacteria bacterium]|nr:radical SAM protein [Deltaproteobacteria bacterium]